MLKTAFTLGVGLGLVGGMFLVKMCPKAEKVVDDIKSKAESVMSSNNSGCECGCDFGENKSASSFSGCECQPENNGL